jgi:ComF family protein
MKIFAQLYSFVFQSLCIFCSLPSRHNICHACQEKLPVLTHYCQQCAELLPDHITSCCGQCLKYPPPFRNTFALFRYEAPMIQLITGLKFQHRLPYALALSELLKERILTDWYMNKPLPSLVIPVPLHKKRLQTRGFNQSLEILRPLSRLITIDIHGVKRIKNTLPQSQLKKSQRAKNITNAFACERDYYGLSIAIFDDVITTGSTVTELAALLKQNGAMNIDVWCCARRV